MKKVQLIAMMLFMMVTTISFGQSISDVVNVDSTTTKETLYSNALSFFALTFKSAQNVIQMKDPESGKVIGKGLLSNGRNVTITFSCRDGKYKYDIEYDGLMETMTVKLNVNKIGILKGDSFLPIIFNNGVMHIDKNKAYIQRSKNGFSDYWKYCYNGDKINLVLSKSSIDTWMKNIDDEILEKQEEFIKLKPKKDYELESLIISIKKEMSKSDW